MAQQDRYARDLTEKDLVETLIEVTACLSVYRTYTRSFNLSPGDKSYIESAIQSALQRNPTLEGFALDFLKRVLLLEFSEGLNPTQKQAWLQWVMRWQQFTGPVTAKGLEDTALYNYNRLLSLNLIGASTD